MTIMTITPQQIDEALLTRNNVNYNEEQSQAAKAIARAVFYSVEAQKYIKHYSLLRLLFHPRASLAVMFMSGFRTGYDVRKNETQQ